MGSPTTADSGPVTRPVTARAFANDTRSGPGG